MDKLDIMVSPEFLDQNKPYFKQKKHLIGVKDIYQGIKYRKVFHEDEDFRTTNIKAAMMAKYIHNVYGSMKVGFFNEYRETVGAMLGMTDHISRCYTRMSVDGERGWGGACFPKDTVAFDKAFPNRITAALIKENVKFRETEMDNVL
jgi:UDP-glucose 6-dehydrogenase